MDRLLLIDDDLELSELLTEYLSAEGFAIETAHDGETGVGKAMQSGFALIVLDVMLPRLNGFEVLRRIRAANRTPVLMLTARGDDVDRIVGLELGADDYLPKPFNPRELVARIRAILRRAHPEPSPAAPPRQLTVADVTLDFGTRTVRRDGQLVDLTGVEFDLLALLLRDAGQIVSREILAKQVLGREFSPFDRSIDMHISNLRRKLGSQLNGIERLKAIRGVGYIYAAPSQL
ncbi:MAG TPA: response regulator transcription factor [Blastocatellia bacterium]|nr:response regulator transcription factor [Blastocatellia bacterium]HMV86238.1 response regulator transcription factor [Blastocatellia bacterium]HMX28144.1 response regulator transcription factor [Blastocatellia bacterium]HMY73401.1 response regulator transcription factor [Blastocatellia bacterium]HMZ19061.1 response regulator transcription factor [Blastocatellia bacterium]